MFISNTAIKGYRFDKGLCLKNSFGRRSNITAERFLGHYRFIPDSELPYIFDKYFNIVLHRFQNYFVQRGSQRSGCQRAALRAKVDFATLRYMETSSAGGERRFGEDKYYLMKIIWLFANNVRISWMEKVYTRL